MTDNPATEQPISDKAQSLLAVYDDQPMQAGDVALLLDDTVCMEVEGLADNWSARVRGNLATALRPQCSRVLIAVARPQRELLASDHVLWAELREELLGSGIELLPIRGVAARRPRANRRR